MSAPVLPGSAAGLNLPAARKPNYILVLAMLAVSLVLSIAFGLKPQDTGIGVADVRNIPLSLGDWEYKGDTPTDPEIFKQMLADSFVSRFYVNKRTRQTVELLVVYRRYGRREFAHRPELCYPAGGYNIVLKDHTTLPYAGRDCPAIHLIADGSHVQQANGVTGVPTTTISYLFASGDRTECDFIRQQLVMAVERLVPNKNGWTFLRLSSFRVTNDADALAAQQDFMRVYGPKIQDVITTDQAAARTVATK